MSSDTSTNNSASGVSTGLVGPDVTQRTPRSPSPTEIHPMSHTHPLTPSQTKAYRELFWQNFIREVLVSLIAAQSQATQELREKPAAPDAANADAMSDGRMGIITQHGQRIPIARIFPVFAQSIEPCDAHAPREVELAQILQCTIFQIETPGGEVYTLPLHEVRGFHALSEQLMEQIANRARRQRPKQRKNEPEQPEPFGFAAFTRTARGSDVPDTHTTPAGAD